MEPRFEIRYTANQKILREFYRKIGTGPRNPTKNLRFLDFPPSGNNVAGLIFYRASQGILSEMAETYTLCGLVLLLLFFMPWYISWKALRSSKRSNDGVIPETRIAVNEDRIDVDEGFVHFTLEYRKFCRVVHLKHSYVLMMGRRNGLMIDPDGFTKGTFAEFKQFLREKRPDLNIPE